MPRLSKRKSAKQINLEAARLGKTIKKLASTETLQVCLRQSVVDLPLTKFNLFFRKHLTMFL